MFSTEFSQEGENSATLLFYFRTLELKHKIKLFADRLRRKSKNGYMLHKN